MTFYERYINGETVAVYEDIYALGESAYSPAYFHDIENVLTATFKRVAFNLDVIYKELKNIDYQFNTSVKLNFEKPLHEPLHNTEDLLNELDVIVKSVGYVPLSLKFFYKIVGGVNFAWDYKTNENIKWELADPIQVVSLNDLVQEVAAGGDWLEMMQEYLDDGNEAVLELAADDYHKDNISGGAPYSLQLTKVLSIDSLFLNEPHSTTFIDYLRICFEHCGFPGIDNPVLFDGFQTFVDKVKPKLQKI